MLARGFRAKDRLTQGPARLIPGFWQSLFRPFGVPFGGAPADFPASARADLDICFDSKDFRLRLEQFPGILIYAADSPSKSVFTALAKGSFGTQKLLLE